jgi:uncharacterized protein
MSAMSRWDALLAVQEHDTRIDQLRHRRRSLPERAELDALMTEVAAVEAAVADAQVRHDELSRGQSRIDDEVASLRAKADKSNDTMYGGTVTNPRQLGALQEEIAALKRRISQLEDQELELMEQSEPVEAELTDLGARRSALDERAMALRARIAEEEATIDAELGQVGAERAALADGVDPDLLREYDGIRARLGIAIARLVGGSCQGCHLSLSAVEVDRIRRLDSEVAVHCEECGRLLAR